MSPRRFVLAFTGASGAVYGRRLLDVLAEAGAEVHLLITPTAAGILRRELDLPLDPAGGPATVRALLGRSVPNVRIHPVDDLEAPPASGSWRHDGMAICPCSMGCAGRLASGVSGNLVERAADVCLKERRPLVLVPRETPLSPIHLENLLRLARAGAVILPAAPGFYAGARRVEDLVDFVVARILDHLGIPHDLGPRHGEEERRASGQFNGGGAGAEPPGTPADPRSPGNFS